MRRFREDWTLISFMLYGATLPLILLDFDEYRYDEGFQAAIFLTLAMGAWGYLRWQWRPARVAALLAAVTVAMLLMGLGKFILLPAQNWTYWFERHPVESERWFEALRTSASWFWTVAALLGPWLIRRRPPVFLVNLALCALFLFLFRPVYPYLEIIFSRQEFRLNQLALAGVIGLLVYQIRHAGLKFHFGSPPALHPLALSMLLGSSALFILAERLVDINTLSASLFGLALYGLLGLWLDPGRWRHGLPAALLLIGTLPFGEHLQTFVGYPVRLLTAVLVRDGLAAFGVHSIGVDTILVFENGISQVDLPCSGVKSLWTGGMFLLAATWIERRRFNRRWLLAALVFAFLLFAANLARVAILITVGQALGLRLLAEMLHVPLGVLGFCGVCLALVWMLRKFVAFQNDFALEQNQPRETAMGLASPRWLSPILFISILLLAVLYTPRPEVAAAQAAAPLVFSEKLSTEPWAFSSGEMAWLSADGPLAASRWRFQFKDYQGSLLLITSDTWRAHHRPERCFEAYGLTVNQSRSLLLDNDFPVRLLSLGSGSRHARATAIYWLQSNERITDDYATRIWSDLSPNRRTWVLVTILFDQSVEPLDADLQELYAGLRQSVAHSLEIGGPP
jgi:exosortase O